METTLVLPGQIAAEIVAAAQHPLETAGTLSCRVVTTASGLRLIARSISWVPEAAYAERKADSLAIKSEGYVRALGTAALNQEVCIWVHTHPGKTAKPIPSRADNQVDVEISDLFKLRTQSEFYGTLIVSPRDTLFTFTGKIELERSAFALDRIWVVGERLALLRTFHAKDRNLSSEFDRNVRALGAPVQQTLAELRVAIIGCGGTGSSVAEQLVRMGVRKFGLFDPDTLSLSNTTRVYGSRPADVGRPKVEVTADHIRHIAPDAVCATFQSMITVEHVARELRDYDIVLGCTDDNAGRLVLSRLSTYYCTPVIDCGVLISSDEGGVLRDINCRITLMYPGQACLLCRGRVDVRRAASELMTPEERVRLEQEGYAPALGRTEPAVVPFTTMTGSAVVAEILERLIGYGPTPRPSEILIRAHDREISTNTALPREGHYCHQSAAKVGLGDTQPFLEQLWTR